MPDYPGHRSKHIGDQGSCCSTRRAACWIASHVNTASTIRNPAGSNTMPRKSGKTCSRYRAPCWTGMLNRLADLIGISITNQRETIVVFDRATGQPLHPAIVWQCQRSDALCEAHEEAGHGPLIQTRTGPAPECLFLRVQTAMAGAKPSRTSSKTVKRRSADRHDRRLSGLPAHRGRGVCD